MLGIGFRWPWVAALSAALVALLWWQVNAFERRAYQRGQADCEAAVAAQVVRERAAAQARVDAADAEAAAVGAQIRQVEARHVETIRTVVRDGPCLDVDGVRAIKAADRAMAEAAGIGAGAVRNSAAAEQGDGRGGRGGGADGTGG